jgi:hypothetical protein
VGTGFASGHATQQTLKAGRRFEDKSSCLSLSAMAGEAKHRVTRPDVWPLSLRNDKNRRRFAYFRFDIG